MSGMERNTWSAHAESLPVDHESIARVLAIRCSRIVTRRQMTPDAGIVVHNPRNVKPRLAPLL
jgi:hypothetical protein